VEAGKPLHSGILKSNTAALRNGAAEVTPANVAGAAMLPGYMSLLRLKESIGRQRAYVSGLICLPRHYTLPQAEFRG